MSAAPIVVPSAPLDAAPVPLYTRHVPGAIGPR
jgi:hypothetical protein